MVLMVVMMNWREGFLPQNFAFANTSNVYEFARSRFSILDARSTDIGKKCSRQFTS